MQAKQRWALMRELLGGGALLSLAAFILSLTVALIGAYYALRGAEVVVKGPESVLLYRDGDGDQAALVAAIRLSMVNTAAADYGDVLMDATLRPDLRSGETFAYSALVQPVFGGDSSEGGCDLSARCIRLPQLKVVEYPDTIADLPGRSANVRTLTFVMTRSSCTGSAACARYGNFASAVAALKDRPLDIAIDLQFNDDGDRSHRCRTAALGAQGVEFLLDVGWITLPCQARSRS